MANLTVEFFHPGIEAVLKYKKPISINNVVRFIHQHYIFPLIEDREIGIRFWNTYPHHKKKLLITKGKYISKQPFDILDDTRISNVNNLIEKECLSFWGEWEPQSFFKLINSDNEQAPKQVHFPFFIEYVPLNKNRFHSTDPFIFGDAFLYTHCLQGPRKDGTAKRTDKYLKSPDLSMILFGYEFPFSDKPNDFFLDALIVIDKTSANSNLRMFSRVFQLANLRFANRTNYKYIGIMQSGGNNIFSFVPCKLYDKTDLFYRNDAKLNWDSLGLRKPGARQGLHVIDNFSNDELIRYWKRIVNAILENGLYLGIELEEPKCFKNYIDAWNYYSSEGNKCEI